MQIFEELRKRNPEFDTKIKAVEGDMMEHNLGISHEDAEKLRNNVSIVFHSAATVRFDEPLRYDVYAAKIKAYNGLVRDFILTSG